MNVITYIIAPPDATQRPVANPPAPATPRLDRLDQLLLQELRDTGDYFVWSLFNALAAEEGIEDRTEARLFRRDLWYRLKRLRRLGLAFCFGRNSVSATKPTQLARISASRHRRRAVPVRNPIHPVSGAQPSHPQPAPAKPDQVQTELVKAVCAISTPKEEPSETESAVALSDAARSLAKLPRRPKRRWTGWVLGQRCWRNRKIILASGEIALLYSCERGQAIYLVLDAGRLIGDPEGERCDLGVLSEGEVCFWRNPDAIQLGRMKAGVKERPSELKARAARENGRRPCAPGKRRGRPRKGAASGR